MNSTLQGAFRPYGVGVVFCRVEFIRPTPGMFFHGRMNSTLVSLSMY